MAPDSARVRERLTIGGIVQGVGFRPHVHGLATELELAGFVVNTAAGVVIEVEGPADRVATFATAVVDRAPPLAVVDSLARHAVVPLGADGFEIRASVAGRAATLVSPDVATCDACLAEVGDPADRRYRYEFANCTNCGPRYTIVTGIPYDRPNTTMASFAMCASCRAEYDDPSDRRFHAQPVCCPTCGPRLDTPIETIARWLLAGDVVALKGLGGYHLMARVADDEAVARLRARKHREDKPFALLVADVAAAAMLVHLDDAAADLLRSPARPIVLLPARAGAPVAPAIAPATGELGVMLPATALHHLLMAAVGEPIVCTSGNVSDEPIAYQDDDARRRLAGIADHVVGHDRPIHIRVDDSVARIIDGAPYLIRRSRGDAPAPLAVPWTTRRPTLACGAELKSTVALARGRRVFVSHHIGDLQNHETYLAFAEAIEHLARLFEITPEVVAHDLHPDYLSTAYATELDDVELVAVQHHHAHVASCLADNQTDARVIGVAFDGTGYGTDGTIWGGEVLVADLAGFERVAHLSPVPLPGGDQAVRQPWRSLLAHLDAIGQAESHRVPHVPWDGVLQIARSGVASPLTSSAGRLFDAIAVLTGVRDTVSYEGQAAIELEQRVDQGERGAYPAALRLDGSTWVMQSGDLVAGALADVRAGVDAGRIAARFHRGLADVTAAACRRVREERQLDVVALSGGVFLNVVLLRTLTALLEADGFVVLRHRRVPCNDGGISFGQAAVAAAGDRPA